MSESYRSAVANVGDPVTVPHGGTGQVTLIDGSILIGNDINPITQVGPLTDGQVLIGDTAGLDPVPATLTEGEAIDITNAAGSITISCEDAAIGNKGVAELATDLEAQVLLDTEDVLTPSNMGAVFALEKQTGFQSWSGAGSYYTVAGSNFTLDRPGTGWVNTKLVNWAGGQTVAALAAGSTHYIYVNSAGAIGSTTTRTTALFQDNIVLFQVLVDSSGVPNVIVVKENHSLMTNPATMNALHNLGMSGYSVTQITGGTIALNGALGIQVNGASAWQDHDLATTIPDSAAAAINMNIMYTNGAGKWVRYALQNTIPTRYNSVGTPTLLAGNQRAIYEIRVSKDDIESAIPQYFAIMGSTLYANLALAQTAVASKTYTTATNELEELETIRMGVVIVNAAAIDSVTVDKQTIGGGSYTSYGSSASTISVNTTNFDGWLSATDTTVQAALETLDETAKDGTFHLENTATGSKIMNFDLSGITAANTRTITMADQNISLVPTTGSFQASDSTLTALAAYNTNGLITQTAADTFTGRTITGTASQIDVANGSGVAANPTLAFSATPTMKQLTVDPLAAGDAFIQYALNTTNKFIVGVDDDDADKFKISVGNAIGTNDAFVMASTGEITKPLQPAFLAKPTASTANQTGDGTTVTIVYGTEIYDQNSDFDGTSTFTAPVTGRYHFDAFLSAEVTDAGFVGLNFGMTTSNRSHGFAAFNPGSVMYSNRVKIEGSTDTDMDAADTAYITFVISGGAKTLGNRDDCFFSGHLVC